MTHSTADRPLLPVEEFEELARRSPKTVRLEFINGKIEVKPVPDGAHYDIVRWLQKLCLQHVPDLWLYPERHVKVEKYRNGRAIPDAILLPDECLNGEGGWSDPEGVLMVVEATSHDSDTNRRDRIEKRDGYAAADIPIYLLIDRENCTVTVHCEPKDGSYRSLTTRPYGTPVELPAPVGFTLETEKLKKFAR
ncbi:Uma2 family endonuclease [Streptomyces sp. SCA3-4]|uniref:Uma2 family endonuclease n=1 Tax=Streptomyces sichuanensis TaxID=2871810 RepID=UPI001CE3ADC0|nr:Uma2 family endonuclease [Streptomyces sichuanensis]MCA6094722.1 Uma2 family endonuclease [Streptomyces sichuanensis]